MGLQSQTRLKRLSNNDRFISSELNFSFLVWHVRKLEVIIQSKNLDCQTTLLRSIRELWSQDEPLSLKLEGQADTENHISTEAEAYRPILG